MSHTKSLFIILNVTHECNMSCGYCYYSGEIMKNPGRMNIDLIQLLLKKLSGSSFDSITFAFHGGEPLLLDADTFREIMNMQKYYLKDKYIENTIQTNATLINDRLIGLLKEHNIRIGVSLDGPQAVHDYYRKFRNSNGTYYKIIENLKKLADNGLSFGVLSVCSDITLEYSDELYSFFKSIKNIRLLDLMPASISHPQKILTEMNYSKIINKIFDQWILDEKCQFELRNLTSIVVGFITGIPVMCTFKENCFNNGSFISIDINGNVSPCDSLTGINLGNIMHDSIDSFFGSNPLRVKHCNLEKTRLEQCILCRWYKYCNGECPSNSVDNSGNAYCMDFKEIFKHVLSTLSDLGIIQDGSVNENCISRIPNPALKNSIGRYAKQFGK